MPSRGKRPEGHRGGRRRDPALRGQGDEGVRSRDEALAEGTGERTAGTEAAAGLGNNQPRIYTDIHGFLRFLIRTIRANPWLAFLLLRPPSERQASVRSPESERIT